MTADSLFAQATELKPGFEERVIKPIAGSLEWIVGVKGGARAREKVALEYDGDARCLKDMLRASIICDTLAEMLACVAAIFALEDAGVIEVKQIKNRFNDGSRGYRDMNWSVAFEGHVCELQLHLRVIVAIKEEAHHSYEVL